MVRVLGRLKVILLIFIMNASMYSEYQKTMRMFFSSLT